MSTETQIADVIAILDGLRDDIDIGAADVETVLDDVLEKLDRAEESAKRDSEWMPGPDEYVCSLTDDEIEDLINVMRKRVNWGGPIRDQIYRLKYLGLDADKSALEVLEEMEAAA